MSRKKKNFRGKQLNKLKNCLSNSIVFVFRVPASLIYTELHPYLLRATWLALLSFISVAMVFIIKREMGLSHIFVKLHSTSWCFSI